MEANKTHKILYSSPTWAVLIYVVEHPEQSVRGSRLTKALPHISKSSIYNAIRLLKEIDILEKEEGEESYRLNRDSIGLNSLMRLHNETLFIPIINGISSLSSKVILFGSRATGDYNSDSDYDLLVVTAHATDVRRIINKSSLANRIQPIIKTPEEWIDLNQQNPELYQSIQRGITLWNRK